MNEVLGAIAGVGELGEGHRIVREHQAGRACGELLGDPLQGLTGVRGLFDDTGDESLLNLRAVEGGVGDEQHVERLAAHEHPEVAR